MNETDRNHGNGQNPAIERNVLDRGTEKNARDRGTVKSDPDREIVKNDLDRAIAIERNDHVRKKEVANSPLTDPISKTFFYSDLLYRTLLGTGTRPHKDSSI